jgi:hypothetical protein
MPEERRAEEVFAGAVDSDVAGVNPTISRADVAAFMHQAAHGSEWIHRSAVITD